MTYGASNMTSSLKRVSCGALAPMLAVLALAAPAFAQNDIAVRVGAFDGGMSPSLAANGPARDFGFTVTNMGAAMATDVRVTVTPPGGGGAVEVPDTSPCVAAGEMDPHTCAIPAMAPGEVVQFTLPVSWAPPEDPPMTCPSANLSVAVAAAEPDPVMTNNSSTLADVVPPLAYLEAEAESPAPPSTDGGIPEKRVAVGENIALKGKVTNLGPCTVPADSITIDSSFDGTGSFGIEFVKGEGGCPDWTTTMPHDSADGVCTVPTALMKDGTVDFTVTQKVLDVGGGRDGGGDSIIQSAAVWNYVVAYDGNPLETAPAATIIVAGPTGSSCSVTGGGLAVALAALALVRRRRR